MQLWGAHGVGMFRMRAGGGGGIPPWRTDRCGRLDYSGQLINRAKRTWEHGIRAEHLAHGVRRHGAYANAKGEKREDRRDRCMIFAASCGGGH